MKKVVLTGAGGFIGAHTLAHFMTNTDWHLILIDSFRHRGKTDRIAEMFQAHPEWKQRCTIITHDLTAPLSDQTISKMGIIDYVVNMASESHVDRSIEDPRNFIENNVDLVLTMLDYARVIKPKKFIQISTDEVYGPAPDGHNHKEGEPHRPSNPYSASKAAQESICFSYWRTYGVPIMITNTMNNFGEMQDSEKFIPMLIKTIEAGQTVTIHGTEQKIGSRFYLHARNHADALLFILNNQEPHMYSDSEDASDLSRFNVVGESEISNLDLAKMIAEMMDKQLDYKLVDFHATRPGHDRRYALDGSKLASLGWKAPVDLQKSLRETINWTLQHREWLL